MPQILLTAFEPYDVWKENSSWLTLVEVTRQRDFAGKVVTRRYPVHLERMRERLWQDLSLGFEYAIHLGQSPGATDIRFEAIGLNLDSHGQALDTTAPLAYRSLLPLESWASQLRSANIPANVSFHAGTYLCNALLFLSRHLATVRGGPTKSTFIHLPLAPQQVIDTSRPMASMSVEAMAQAINLVIDQCDLGKVA